MATLGFKVNADYEKVIRLREEIRRLEGELSKVNMNTPKEQVRSMQEQLITASKDFKELTQAAMKTGAAMEGDFKNKINIATVALNEMNRKVLEQKTIVQDAAQKVKDLGKAYREATSSGKKSSGIKTALFEATANLEQDKAVLLELTQTQARARLSVKELKDEYASLSKESGKTKEATDGLNLGFGKLVAMLGGAQVLKGFASQIVSIRAQFQDMETSIETLVGKDMTAKLMPQIKEMAKVSPLTMTDIVGAEKMMLGFNIEAEKTIDYLKALSDVSMGNSQKFNSLTLAFSQMSAAGKLMGQDLNQMINSGFNPLQEIARTTGKTISQLKEEMSKGKVSAEMVQQAFISATSEGGKYYKMSENASKTITGQISMMEDAIDAAFNEMGTKTEGIILKSIQSITKLIENYETIGKIIISVAATYGTYRAALLVTTASEKLAALSRLANIKHMTMQALVTDALTKKTKALNLAMKGNVWALALSALVALGGAIWSFVDGKREEKKAIEESNKVLLNEVTKVNALNEEYKNVNTTEERRLEILKEMKDLNPEVVKGIEDEAKAVEQLQQNVDLYNKQKTVELAVNKSDEKLSFDSAKNNLDEAKAEVESLKSDMINIWTDISPKLQDMLMSDKRLPKAVKEYLKRVLLDPAKDSGQKALELLNIDAGGSNLGYGFEGHKAVSKLLRGHRSDIAEYNRAIYSLKVAQKEYTTAANDLATRVDNTVDNLYGKTEQAAQIKMNLNFMWMPTSEGSPTPYLTPATSPNLEKTYKEREQAWKDAKKALNDANKERDKYNVAQYDALVADEQTKRKEFNAVGGDTTTKKTTTAQKDPILEKLKQQQKDAQAARKIQDITNRIRQLIINEEKDEKKRAELILDFENEREIERIEREKEDYINALVNAEYEKNVAFNKTKRKNQKKKETDVAKIREEVVQREEVKAYDEIIRRTENAQDRAIAEKKKKREDADRIKYLKEYGDYKQKVLAITEEYNDKIAKAENEWERKSLEAERDKVLKDMELAKDKAYQNIFKDTSKLSSSEIQSAIKKAEAEIEKIQSKDIIGDKDIENIKILQEAVDKLKEALSSKAFEGFGDGLKGIADKVEKLSRLRKKKGNAFVYESQEDYDEANALKESLSKNLKGFALQKGVEAFSNISHSLHDIADTLGDGRIKAAAQAFDEISSSLTTAIESFAQGGPIYMLLNVAIEQIMKPFILLIEFFESGAINTKAIQDANKELANLELTLENSKFDTIFGEDKWGKIADAGDKWRRAAEEWEKVSEITFDEMIEDFKKGEVFADSIAQTFANSQSVSLGNMWVQARGVGKKKNSGYLQNLFPDIFDENGNLRRDKLEQAKVVLESLKSMKLADDSVIKALEENIGIAEKMNEAADALKKAASDYLGTIAQDLGDIIVDSILKGEDALEQLGDVGAEIITQLGRDLAQTWLINNYLKQFEEPIQEAFKSGDQEAVAKIVGNIVEGFPAMLESGQQLVQGIFDATKGTEYDVYEHAKELQNQQASAKGYATLSEETGGELSARALAEYESNLRMEASQREATATLLDLKETMFGVVFTQQKTNFIAEDCRKLIADSYTQLQAIRENTDAMVAPIQNLSKRMNEWHTKIMDL